MHQSNASGSFEFEFKLYDASMGGNQMDGTVTKGDVTVTDCLFTVSLDFGNSAFTGDAHYLEIGIRAGSSSGPDITLSLHRN